MKIVKRTGEIVDFNPTKITAAIVKAFHQTQESTDSYRDAKKITKQVVDNLTNDTYSVETIQDYVETLLMKNGFYKTSKCYILYRFLRAENRPKVVSSELGNIYHDSSQYFDNDTLREFVYFRTYSRWIPSKSRREVWSETVDRYMNFMKGKTGNILTSVEYEQIKSAILKQEVMPSMRLLQFAGAPAERCNVCVYNCAFTAPTCFKDLADIMYLCTSGTGVGFSVESMYVDKFPVIKKQKTPLVLHEYVIQDSKEGWCDAFEFGLNKWYEGEDVSFDYSLLRPAGARLKTMGGRSSGPQPLIDLLDYCRNIITKRQGHKLTTLNMYDIICKIGQIVVSGGVRRTALISISDLHDTEIRNAKEGAFWNTNPQRSMANNSAAYNEKPSMIEFMNEWLSLAESGTGERGIFNRGDLDKVMPPRRVETLKDDVNYMGMNPCVTGDTWVHTVKGPRQVIELVGCKTDLIVNGTVRQMDSDGFFLTGTKPVYQLKTKRGNSLKLTDNHKLVQVVNGTEKWVELKDLKPGDTLALSNHRDKTEWEGRGSFSEGYGDVHSNGSHKYSSEYQRGYLQFVFNSQSEIKHSLNGSYISLNDTSLNYISDIRQMLARFGIQSELITFIRDLSRNPSSDCYYHKLIIRNDNLITYSQTIGYTHTGKHAILEDIISTELKQETFTDVITSIVYVGEEPVYDVTVKDVHEFCANGIRAHNCGEILLKPMQFCNLSEVICRSHDTIDTLKKKIRIATMIGTYQSSLTNFKYISPKWKENQELERLLGVSLTGQWDCPVVRSETVLTELRDYAIQVNKEYSQRYGINQSTSITAIKPSGTVSQLTNSSSGIHPRFSEYYIRRIRISATDPLLKLMKDQGYPCSPEVGQSEHNANTFVLDFPVKSPDGAICASDMTAIEQLEYWKKVKVNYTEHNPSVTIYIKPDEWLQAAQWVWTNWEYISGLSFLPYSDHVYQLAPYEKINKEQYETYVSKLTQVDFSKLVYYETEDATDVKKEVACSGGVCEL